MRDHHRLVQLARDLVRIPSVYRPADPEANESRVAAFIEAWFRREGFTVEVQDVQPGDQAGISKATFFAWRAKYGGATVADLKRLKELEQENTRLGSERNAQRMLDRIEPYQKKVKLHEDNIANLRKELGNLR